MAPHSGRKSAPLPFRDRPTRVRLSHPVLHSNTLPFSVLEEPTRTMEDVGRGVAHKLRSGLCALNGGIQLSLQQMLPGPTREMLALAERGAHHITEIVKDLVLLTQRPAFNPRPLDMNLLLNEFLNGLHRQPEWEDIAVTRRLDGSLPLMMGDPDLLDTVFDAVAKNAVEAMASRNAIPREDIQTEDSPPPPSSHRLSVETFQENNTIVVRMTDTGVGLTTETMQLAFQPYFSTKSGRRGMGLPLSRWLVHVHGGSMSLRSRPETGTTVTFRFPNPASNTPAPH